MDRPSTGRNRPRTDRGCHYGNADLHATIGVDLIADHLDPHDLPGSLQRIVEAISTSAAEDDTSWRGMRYVIEEPSVRAAVYATADEISERLATVLRDGGAQPTQARVTARAYLFGVYFGALEQWHLDGRREPLGHYIQRGADALLATPAQPSNATQRSR